MLRHLKHFNRFPEVSSVKNTSKQQAGAAAHESILMPNALVVILVRLYVVELKFFIFEIKSSLYSRHYAQACNEWRVHLHGLAPGQHSSEETSQRWRAVIDTVSDLTG